MKESRSKAEINGSVLLVGIGILSIGTWIVWSFGISVMVMGASVMGAALIAKGDD